MNRPIPHKPALILLVCMALLLFSCKDGEKPRTAKALKDSIPEKQAKKDLSLHGNFSTQTVLHFDSGSIASFIQKYPLFKPLSGDVYKFYASRQFAYAWYDKNGLVEQADNLYNHLMNLTEEGLPEKIYYKDSLYLIFDKPSSARNAENDLMLTAQYFTYANMVWGGIPEKETRAINWFLPRKIIDLPLLLDSLLKDSSVIGNGYAHRQYNLLKSWLGKYRNLEDTDDDGILLLGKGKSTFKKGDSAKEIVEIRRRLFKFGDLSVNSGSALFDDELEAGIRSYQTRMGLISDGTLGAETLVTLNTPIRDYVRKIMVNMERSRWVPAMLTGDYFIINIPAFELFAFEKDSLVFTMKVVVGQEVHKTVIFNGDLKYIVFSPYWNVPPDIMKREILPGIRKDPAYLTKHDMEWNGKTIRQKPGPKNSLGLVKFLFPNSYNIYLHDSPAKSLFNKNTRAFSHGCIRLAEPKKMAAYLLRDIPQWTDSKIVAAMNIGKEQWVTLKDPVPVYIAYLTAWVGRDGKLNLRDDIYHRDEQLASMLFKDKD